MGGVTVLFLLLLVPPVVEVVVEVVVEEVLFSNVGRFTPDVDLGVADLDEARSGGPPGGGGAIDIK